HHSATADRTTGAPVGNAHVFFDYHVRVRGWTHGGYNYVITGTGEIEYALDEKISAYHAGFKDPDNSAGLEYGQYWNNHYLAICLAGWFSDNRTYRDASGRLHPIPNRHTAPSEAQMKALTDLVQYLRQKYSIPVENVRGHRELAGNSTECPGQNFDPARFRETLRALDEAAAGPPEPQPEVHPGEHVVLLADADQYLTAAMAYIWRFQPDVSFALEEAEGRWPYVTLVGSAEAVSGDLIARLKTGGARLVQPVVGSPETVQAALDSLVARNQRFDTSTTPTPEPPAPEPWRTYTVQPGDTLSFIARQFYGDSSRWRLIFEANRDILTDPGQIFPGMLIKIPPLSE
ncbi:MAG: LysM peptidoglycan-binding domain-containing protein, partial [Chloroflexi bacterium]